MSKARELGLENIDKATVVDPDDREFTEPYGAAFLRASQEEGREPEDARYTVKNPLYLGCLMIKNGDADCQVAGALSTTGNVLRAAFQVLKMSR